MPENETTPIPKARGHQILTAGLTAVLIIVLLALLFTATYVISASMRSDPFTELYLLGPGGKADNYPYLFNVSEPRPVIVGVANHEHKAMDYDLVVTLENGTQKYKLYEDNLSLADNKTWSKQINIDPPVNGTNMKLDFQLYKKGNMAVPYRDCFLYVTVETPWVSPAAIVINNTTAIQ